MHAHFAYICAYDGILLLPQKILIDAVNRGNLAKSEKDGHLIHYYIRLRDEGGNLIWIVSAGILENVEQYYHRSHA